MTSTLIIPVALLLTSIIPIFASSPLNASLDEMWKNAVRKGSLLYDQMQSGCFPDKEDPITFSELRAQGWEIGDGTSPRPLWPPRPELPFISSSIARTMTEWTQGEDYDRVRIWHRIGMSFQPLEMSPSIIKNSSSRIHLFRHATILQLKGISPRDHFPP